MSRRSRLAVAVTIGVLLVAAPILLAENCSGWNEGTGVVRSCHFDTPSLRDAASTIDNLLLLSAFFLGIPILLYLALVAGLMLGLYALLGVFFPSSPANRGAPSS